MKQVIPFVKDLTFNTRISEITSIALEHNLQMENNDSIVGDFTVSGKYKINDISINEEVFEKVIPFDITLDDKYDASKVQIDIDDFYYEIINDEILRVHIDVLVNNLVYAKEEAPVLKEIEEPVLVKPEEVIEVKTDEVKAIDNHEGDEIEQIDIHDNEERNEVEKANDDVEIERNDKVEPNEEVLTQTVSEATNEETKVDVARDFSSTLLSSKEEYVMYKVHIVRDDDTIETIKNKYNVSTEELEKYNTLDNITQGTKLIIPLNNE